MKKSDFETYDELKKLVSSTAHSYKRSTQRWVEIVQFWQEVAPKHFGQEVEFEIVESSSRVDGIAVGQRFAIHSSLARSGDDVALRAGVLVRDRLNDKEIELDGFLVKPDGSISSLDGEQLLDRDDDLREYKLLSAIVNRVFGVTKG